MEARKSAKLLAWLIALAVVFTMTLPSSVVWAAEGDASGVSPHVNDKAIGSKHDAGTVFFAEGYDVTISDAETEDGKIGFTATWLEAGETKSVTVTRDVVEAGKTLPAAKAIYVVGGSESDANLAETNVTVEGGNIDYVVGGNLSDGKVTTANVTINDGTIGIVHGATRDLPNSSYADRKEKASIDTVNMKISGGEIQAVVGGTFGYTYVKNVNVDIDGGDLNAQTSPVQSGIMLAGTNGEVENAVLNFSGGTTKDISLAQRTMVTGKAEINLTGGTVNDIYAGSYYADTDNAEATNDWENWKVGDVNYGQAEAIDINIGGNAKYNDIYAGFQFLDKDKFEEKYKDSVGNVPTIEGSETAPVTITLDKNGTGTRGEETQHTVSMIENVFPIETLVLNTAPEKELKLQEDCKVITKDGIGSVKAKIGETEVTLQENETYSVKDGKLVTVVAAIEDEVYFSIEDAIDAAEAGDTVTLLKDITVDMGDKDAAAIAITKNLTLDGNGKTIAANKIDAKEGMGHILGIQGANVKVRDLTIDGTDKSARHGIQVYGEGSKATLYSVTVKDCFGYGLVVNGATATATRLTTDGNGWGGVNVTKGNSITSEPSFTLKSGTLNEAVPVQADNVDGSNPSTNWVAFEASAGEWDIITDAKTGDGKPAIQWKPAAGEAVAQVNGANYATLETAITAAKENATVKLLKDITVKTVKKNSPIILLNKTLTLDGNGKTITAELGDIKPAEDAENKGMSHVLGLQAKDIVVKNLTINGGDAARHGVQTYGAGNSATLENVTIKDCTGYGAVANGSTIIANGLNTIGNGWGGVNVSKGSSVQDEPYFEFNGGKLEVVEGTAPIQIDNVDKDVDVVENWVKIDEEALGPWHTETPKENVIVFLPGEDIDKVTLNTTKMTLEVGDKAQLIATVSPENAYNKDVTWSVPGGTKAIEVDADTGVVTALEKIEAVEVTATAKNRKTATCQVSVNEDADETTTLTVQPSVTNGTINANDIITAINNAEKEEATEILVDVPDNANNVISKDVFVAAKEGSADKLIIETKNATFAFDADKIDNPADVNVGITTVPKDDVDVDEWLPGAATEAIQLTHDGNFPAPATITYTLSKDSDITAGNTVYLYYHNGETLELIAQDAITVAEDNSVTFTLAHASAYVFSTEKVEAATVADNVEQAIKAIGTVTYTDESKDAIEKAREQYDLFVAQYADDKDLVTNLKTLTDAEAAYKALDDEVQAFKAEFDAFYDGVDGTMTYDQQKQVPELEKAYNALNQEQKDALGQEYADKIDEMDKVCEASQNAEIVSQANRVSKAVAEKLPTNVAFTTAVKSQIDAVRALYDSVVAETPDAKVLLTSELAAIEKAEAAYKTAKRAAYSSAKISLSTTKYTYNGKAKRPTVKGLSAFVNGTDYTIAYKSNVKSGKATVTVTGKGDCAGLVKTATFRIVPNKAAISKLTKGKRNMKVRIKSQKKAAVSGYQIAYKYGKSGKYKKVTTTKLTKKIRKLKTKKYYYVKVRAYKKIDGKKYYGTYSKIKKIKVR